MEPFKGKQQYSLRGYNSAFPHNRFYHDNNNSAFPHNRLYHDNNSFSMSSSHGIFKTSRIQRHTLKWRKDHYLKGNCRSKFPYKKIDFGGKKPNKTAEDVEEEERKKKLSDTANKLLSKIKTWNAESSRSEDEAQPTSNVNPEVSESSCKCNEEKMSSEGKAKRIAHSKKAKLLKNRTPKNFSLPVKPSARYDVNKHTVKDFQSRIQHKLIEEIMQMPKENLQNVLNDPKINPIMELKMSRLVRENKLLIAQKLRSLAEAKMKLPGCMTNPQLLVDIDKLIDPVIETDLSVLPFELIKQMENIFQVQFDYSPNTDSLLESDACDSSVLIEKESPMDINNGNEQLIKEENNEDLSLYECSTDEDEEADICKFVGVDQEPDSLILEKINNEIQETNSFNYKDNERNENLESVKGQGEVDINKGEKPPPPPEENHLPPKDPTSSQRLLEESVQHSSSPVSELTSTSCQTEGSFENSSTQTENAPDAIQELYGVPLPKEARDESMSSLLEEVNSIQNLTNKLSERKFEIFLKLANMNPSGNFLSDEATKNNFIETISNGNFYLIESLKQFLSAPQRSKHKWNENCRKPPVRNNNKKQNKFRQSDNRKTRNQ